MKNKRNALLIGLLILALVFTSIGCSTSTAPSDKEQKEVAEVPQVLKIANEQEPAGLDPHKVPAHSSIRIYSKIYEGLLTFNNDMEIIGKLAGSWEQPDDVTYIFNLIKGVKFHNGREMTAEDVKYSFERILDKDTASIAYSYFSKVEEIEVVDPYTVKFVLSETYAPFLTYLTTSYAVIVPKEVVEEKGDLMQVAVGTGPFKLKDWVPDNYVTLVKNEDYYLPGQPKLDEIKFFTMKDEAARLAAIRTGEVDLAVLSAQSVPLVEKNERVNVLSYQSMEYSYVGFNLNKEPLNNQKVRQALSLATNRQEVADIVWKGDATISGPVPSSLKQWAIDVTKEELYQNNIEKAKALLAEAGYPNGFKISITTAASYPDMVETAQLLQQQWKEIGVNVEIKQIEWGQYIDAWKNTSHDMLVGRNGSGTDPDRSLAFFFHTDGSANVWGFSNSNYDNIVEQGRVSVDLGERQKLYYEAQKQLIDSSPNLFLVSPMKYVALRDNVKGFIPYPHDQENLIDVTIE